MIDVESDIDEINKSIKKKEEPINKYGEKRVRFSVDNSLLFEPMKAIFTVSLNKQKMCEF